jgi:hypothetical protein
MGNQSSNLNEKSNDNSLAKKIDFIATNLILTQNFNDMKNLSDMNYCDNLVILTSNVIQNNLKHLDVYYLSQRLRSGEEVNEMISERISYIKKDNLSEIDIKNKTNKRRMCIGIAKFYVKLAHLFAAIVTTLNPTYTYKNSVGETQMIGLEDKTNIPSNTYSKLENINICGNRIRALINNHDYNVDNRTEIGIKPDFCQMNYDTKSGNDKKLTNEPGIPELQHLYYDKYDYDQGGFGGKMNMEDNMTTEMYSQYKKDLLSFYKTFTGNNEIPMVDSVDSKGNKIKTPAVKKFSDIPLRTYHKSEGCMQNGLFNREYRGTFKERLFYEYAQHIKKMLNKTETVQAELLKIIDKLFVFGTNPESGSKQVVINPSLTEVKLQKIVDETRKIIVNLYLTCEEDFVKGLDIFEAIVETQIKETSINQIKQLEKALDETLSKTDIDSPVPIPVVESKEEPVENQPIKPVENQPIKPVENQPIKPVENQLIKQAIKPMPPVV